MVRLGNRTYRVYASDILGKMKSIFLLSSSRYIIEIVRGCQVYAYMPLKYINLNLTLYAIIAMLIEETRI